jgi:hypothetical protein
MDGAPGEARLVGAGSPFTERLEEWAAGARVDDAAARRSRERWLQEAAAGDASFAGVLIDLAERGQRLQLQLATGRRVVGTIEGLGADFVAVAVAPVGDALVPLLAIDQVAALDDAPVAGERAIATDLRLADVLAALAGDRERVRCVGRDATSPVAGVLRSAGTDVVTVRTDADPAVTVSLPIASLTEVLVT